MSYAFSKNCLKCLAELDPRLRALAVLMLEKQVMDFAVICGHRGEAEQNAAFAAGEWDDKSPLWDELAALERRCADELGIKVANAIPWDRPHCELVEE